MRRRVPLPRRSIELVRGPTKRSGTPIRPLNVDRRRKRQATYKARLRRPDWQLLREQCFERDGHRCVHTIDGHRCPNGRANGTPLHANHKTYARFGRELLSDMETICEPCDGPLTVATRANWTGDRRARLAFSKL
jgi:5-methylcytosine-specific restriction endonuclease McrA